jgi:hypothetical protein
MKKLVLLFVALSFAGCSSKDKGNASDAEATQTVEEKAATATSEATDAKSKLKKVKAAASEEAAATDSSGGFGAVTGSEKMSFTCTKNSDTRKVAVVTSTSEGCGVVYNKAGQDKTVAVAKSDLSHCDTVAEKIKTNLQTAGFDCGGEAAAAAPSAAPAPTEATH